MSTVKEEKIEKYLRNLMSENEKAAFQFELLRDKALREEVNDMRILQKTLASQGGGAASKSSTDFRPLLILGLFALPIIAFLLFRSFGDTTQAEVPPTSTEQSIDTQEGNIEEEVKPGNEEINPPVKPAEDESTEQEKTDIEKIIEEQSPEKVEEREVRQPIALADPADLVPNPYFEQMSTGTRGSNITIEPVSPLPNAVLTWQKNSFILPFRGAISYNGSAPNISLLIFDNRKSSSENWNYLEKVSLSLDENSKTYSAKPNLQLKRGLYYYYLEDQDTEMPILVGKFEVK